eukprot:UN33102
MEDCGGIYDVDCDFGHGDEVYLCSRDFEPQESDASCIYLGAAGPVITNENEIIVMENQELNFQIETESDNGVSYVLKGIDSRRFSLDEQGVLNWLILPSYGEPSDTDEDNVYMVIILVTDKYGQESSQTLHIAVHEDMAFEESTKESSSDGGQSWTTGQIIGLVALILLIIAVIRIIFWYVTREKTPSLTSGYKSSEESFSEGPKATMLP